jgi:hypothetical protein
MNLGEQPDETAGQACVLYGAAEFSRGVDFAVHVSTQSLQQCCFKTCSSVGKDLSHLTPAATRQGECLMPDSCAWPSGSPGAVTA